MKSISKRLIRLTGKVKKTITEQSIQKDLAVSGRELCRYPLSHHLNISLQKRIQLARANLYKKLDNTGFDPSSFDIVPISIAIPRLDPAFQGYRLVQISDIHIGQWLTIERMQGVMDLVNLQKPDLVAITGDFISYIFEPLARSLADSLKMLHPRDAAVAVLGNHDHWAGAERIRDLMKKSNIKDLSNDIFTISRDDAELHIAGVDSIMVNQDRLDLVMKKMPPVGPAILLAHEPDFADVSSKTGRFSLQISGHSHGGQFIIPGLGTPIRGYHFWKYPLGRYKVGDMVQYTNRGLGTNLFWSRINCPPEITVFTLETGD